MKPAKVLFIFASFWLLIWSLPITSILFGSYLEKQYQKDNLNHSTQADAILLLGGNTIDSRKNWFTPSEQGGRHSRLDTALKIYKEGKAKQFIISSGALEGNVSDAKGMAIILEREGINPKNILLEEKSKTTFENFYFSEKIIKEKNIHSVLLVTSALHMPRAMAVAKKFNLIAYPAQSPPQISPPEEYSYKDIFVPSLDTLKSAKTILKEYIALSIYWFRGWI